MNLKEMRARLLALQVRMQEINRAAEDGKRALSADEQTEWNTALTEFNELRAKVEAETKRQADLAGVTDYLNRSQQPPIQQNPDANSTRDGLQGSEFRTFGEFLHAVRFNQGHPGIVQLRKMSMEIGSEGGILVPEQFAAEILRVGPEDAIIRPRARVLPAGSPPDAKISFPALTQGSGGVYGGVSLVWTAEGATMDETDAELSEVALESKEFSGYVTVTNKLLNNSAAASALLTGLLRDAKNGAEDYCFLRGDGVGKPLGILNCTGTLSVSRNTTNNIKYADIVNMFSKLFPDSWGYAMWIANMSALPKIAVLEDAAGNNIFIQGDATKALPMTLAGMPMRLTGRTPTLGNAGDLMLVDARYYMIKDGSGPFIAASEHVEFKANKTVIKIVGNVDGQGWVQEPLTLEDGSTQVSPFIALN